jgi:outer membrane putative beta-barrel porin/alpha-amylase
MKELKTAIAAAAFGAMSLYAVNGPAYAGSTTQPGETVGISLGAPLPAGVYIVNTGSFGRRAGTDLAVNIPVVAWYTPMKVAGGQIALLGAWPELASGNHSGGAYSAGMYNPIVAAMIAWDLGNGLGVSYLIGDYFAVDFGDFKPTLDQNTVRQDVHVSYANGDWTAAVNLIYGIVGRNGQTRLANPDFFNYDLSLTTKIGKWEVGPVGFGSTDVSSPSGHASQSQFALGGLVGYNFGPVIVQAYLTTDVYQTNYGGRDTRGWLRLVVPL